MPFNHRRSQGMQTMPKRSCSWSIPTIGNSTKKKTQQKISYYKIILENNSNIHSATNKQLKLSKKITTKNVFVQFDLLYSMLSGIPIEKVLNGYFCDLSIYLCRLCFFGVSIENTLYRYICGCCYVCDRRR